MAKFVMASFAVLTTCTGRKRLAAPVSARFREAPAFGVYGAARQWFSHLSSCQTTKAGNLYSGRGFKEARLAAGSLSAPLFIASAGLGLVSAEAIVPAYEATISPNSPDNVCKRLGVVPSEWWAALQATSPYATAGPPREALILVASSGPYLQLLRRELMSRPVERIRLFSRTGVGSVPPELRPALMPYDARFDAPGGPCPGTFSDFPQRALRHFAEHILVLSPDADAQEHARLVQCALTGLKATKTKVGRVTSDDEIRAIIEEHFDRVDGRSSRMLRKLRDELGIACEQSRFRDLFRDVRASYQKVQ
jgi:hypothetical protein